MNVALPLSLALIGLFAAPAPASEFSAETVHGSLKTHCADCHTGGKSKGRFDLTQLGTGIEDPAAARAWERILLRVEAGEMPPPDEPRPPAADMLAVQSWAKSALAAFFQSRRARESRTRMRRLNRLEYENTLHDLLGIQLPLQEFLPPDSSGDSFDTASSTLSISPVHIRQYMAASEAALKAAVVHSPRPASRTHRFHYEPVSENEFMEHPANKPMIRPRNGVLVFFAEPHPTAPAKLTQFADLTKTHPGRYRVRVSCQTLGAADTTLTFAVKTARRKTILGFFDAPPGKPAVFEAEHQFSPGETIVLAPYHLNEARGERGLSQFSPKPWSEPGGLGLAIHWVDVEGPLVDAWPPAGHCALFGALPLLPFKSLPEDTVLPGDLRNFRGTDHLTPCSPDAAAEARRLLTAFLPRAFRRPVTEEDIKPYLYVALGHLQNHECFESAMLAAYQAVLCSPHFLFLVEGPGPLNDHALAARLSYFFWRSMPDEALRATASRGELREPAALRRETERLLSSPRAQTFVHDFLDQWLHLRDIDTTTPDQQLFPECFENHESATPDSLLRESILAETRLFFADLLERDGSLLQLVDSDFTYLNSRLAAHYGLPPVKGSALLRVALPPDSVRGGVLTQASVLKVTANGSTTSPVLRGVWLLNNILGRHPPPPPANVGAIEPDTRGANTIREQLAKHQNTAACAGCHCQIDPPGFALECFDPMGQWRAFYRTTDIGTQLEATTFNNGAKKVRVRYLRGPDVDASGRTANGQTFSSPKEFKQILLGRPELIARNLASKLLAYSTGRRTEPGDIQALDELVARTKAKQYGLRSILHEIVQSDLFLKN